MDPFQYDDKEAQESDEENGEDGDGVVSDKKDVLANEQIPDTAEELVKLIKERGSMVMAWVRGKKGRHTAGSACSGD